MPRPPSERLSGIGGEAGGLKPSQTCFGLVDCNNFYVSCERVFDPRLEGRPVVILSNNDGCIIARSEEAKLLGVPMAAPFFRWRDFLRQNDVAVLSSNYALYGDLSQRVMALLHSAEPDVEVYSIDEAFVAFGSRSSGARAAYARCLRDGVRQSTGVPVTIGIAATKTLAKVANRIAKRHTGCTGVLDMTEHPQPEDLLGSVDVADVWGIGARYARRLQTLGIATALDLREADPAWCHRRFSVNVARTVMELRGQSAIPLDAHSPDRKSTTCSRSFGRPVATREGIEQAVTTFVARAAEKLRKQHSVAACMQVFLVTRRCRETDTHAVVSRTAILPEPTSVTPLLARRALACVRSAFRTGTEYTKAGVVLSGLTSVDRTLAQPRLFASPDDGRLPRLMQAVDRINARWGRNTVRFGAMGYTGSWQMQQAWKSRRFTTCWEDLPVVRA